MIRKRTPGIRMLLLALLFLLSAGFTPLRAFAATVGQTSIKLSASGETKIKVKASSVKGGSWYQYQLSTDQTFSKVLQNRKSKKNTCIFKDLTRGTTYYVRVRAYATTAGNKRVFGLWSKTLSVSTGQKEGSASADVTGIGWKDAYIRFLKTVEKDSYGKGMLVDLGYEVPGLEFCQYLIWYAPGHYDDELKSPDIWSLYSALADSPVSFIKGQNSIRQNVWTYFGMYKGEPLHGTVTTIYRIKDGELTITDRGVVKYYDDGKNNSYEWNGKTVSREWYEKYMEERATKETFVSGSEEKYTAERIIEEILEY